MSKEGVGFGEGFAAEVLKKKSFSVLLTVIEDGQGENAKAVAQHELCKIETSDPRAAALKMAAASQKAIEKLVEVERT